MVNGEKTLYPLTYLLSAASIMVSATEILANGVFWPRKNTEDHGIIEMTSISVHFRGKLLSLDNPTPAEGVIKAAVRHSPLATRHSPLTTNH